MIVFTVIKDTLDNRGVLGQIKARIRAEVFNALDDQSETKPPLSNENMIINELIREYLEFNRYKYTSSVLVSGRFYLCFHMFKIDLIANICKNIVLLCV